MGRKCEFYWCGNQQGNGISFYTFPNDNEMCLAWVERCNSLEASNKFRAEGPLGFRNKRICSKHFPLEAFKEPTRKEKGLVPNALPFKCPNNPSGCSDELHVESHPAGTSFQHSEEDPIEFIEGDLDYVEWERRTAIMTNTDTLLTGDPHSQPGDMSLLRNDQGPIDFATSMIYSIDMPSTTDHADQFGLPSSHLTDPVPILEPHDTDTLTNESPKASPKAILNANCTGDPEGNPSATDLHSPLDGTVSVPYQIDFSGSMSSHAIYLSSRDTTTLIPEPYSINTYPPADSRPLCPTYETDGPPVGNRLIHQHPEVERHSQLRNTTTCSANPSNDDTTLISIMDTSASSQAESYKAQVTVKDKIIKSVKEELRCVKRKLFVSQQTGQRRLKSALRAKRENGMLKQKLKASKKMKTDNEMLGARARSNPIIFDFIRNSKRKPKGRRYNSTTMKFAAGAYLSGPRAYRYVRNSKHVVLPHKSSVYKYNRHIRLQPGINSTLLAVIKKKVREMKHKKNKIVTLTCDGMSIKKDLSYSAKADIFHGFPDDGVRRKVEKNDPSVLATEAVVVMVSGMYLKFKQPIGYYLAHNSLGSKGLYQLLEASIRAVRKCGMNPLIITMDQCSTNMKMVHEHQTSTNPPKLKIDGHESVVLYDPPHLMKNTRNSVFKHNAVFDGKIASFEHIRKLYDIDISSTLRIVPKLQKKCIDLPPFAAMNVALAARILSESCATGMRYYVETRELPDQALETAEFIEMHDKLFDIFNSKDKYTDSIGKPYRTPITAGSSHFNFLDEVEPILEGMYYTTNSCFEINKTQKESTSLKTYQRRPHYLKGWISNIKALRWLWNILRKDFLCSYLCTNVLCQDCLENFFSEIRRRCGFNDAPNAFQFGSAFKYAMIAAAEQGFGEGTNCQHDTVNPLLREDDVDDLQPNHYEPFHYEHEPLDLKSPFDALKKELNVLVYIIGAAASKLPHKKCKTKLTAQQDEECLESEDYSFIKMKASCSSRNITIPNNTLYAIGLLAFVTFKQKFRPFLYQNRQNVKTRLKTYLEYESYDYATCESCFHKLVDIIFNTLIQGFLRDVRVQNKVAEMNKRRGKRNRKAIRMNLPQE